MPGFVTRRPNNHHHSVTKKSDRLEACFTVVAPCVLYGNRWTRKDDQCIGKIQTPFAESCLTFCRSNVIFTPINVPPFNSCVNLLSAHALTRSRHGKPSFRLLDDVFYIIVTV
jgi:hypothetical protein